MTVQQIDQYLSKLDPYYLSMHNTIKQCGLSIHEQYCYKQILETYINHRELEEESTQLKTQHEHELVKLHYKYQKEITSLMNELTEARKLYLETTKEFI